MESLFSFPEGSCIPYNMPVYPGALWLADDSIRAEFVAIAQASWRPYRSDDGRRQIDCPLPAPYDQAAVSVPITDD
jgi:hypothetical protein